MTKKEKQAYNREFQDTTIQLALAGDKTITAVASELGLPEWKLMKENGIHIMKNIKPESKCS